MSFNELYDAVKAEMGDELDTKVEEIKEELLKDKSLDERDFSMKVVEEVHKLWSDKDPVVVVYYSPPYYPHIYVEGSEHKEKILLESVDEAVDAVESDYQIVSKKFYPYISDLSFVSAPKDPKIMEALKSNMPALDSKYKLPLDAMQKLGLPVVNIGPFGKDAHKFTERLEKKYSFEVAPKLVKHTIESLLSK
jgi:arginine utilization protein RocB